MPPWLTLALEAVTKAPAVAESLMLLWTHIHNEMTAGSGQTNPAGITQALIDHAGEIATAVEAPGEKGDPTEADPADNSADALNAAEAKE
jgi:hypothetical protein